MTMAMPCCFAILALFSLLCLPGGIDAQALDVSTRKLADLAKQEPVLLPEEAKQTTRRNVDFFNNLASPQVDERPINRPLLRKQETVWRTEVPVLAKEEPVLAPEVAKKITRRNVDFFNNLASPQVDERPINRPLRRKQEPDWRTEVPDLAKQAPVVAPEVAKDTTRRNVDFFNNLASPQVDQRPINRPLRRKQVAPEIQPQLAMMEQYMKDHPDVIFNGNTRGPYVH